MASDWNALAYMTMDGNDRIHIETYGDLQGGRESIARLICHGCRCCLLLLKPGIGSGSGFWAVQYPNVYETFMMVASDGGSLRPKLIKTLSFVTHVYLLQSMLSSSSHLAARHVVRCEWREMCMETL